jgi:hypothetical protein
MESFNLCGGPYYDGLPAQALFLKTLCELGAALSRLRNAFMNKEKTTNFGVE